MPFDTNSLLAATRSAPDLDPQSVYGIASSSPDPYTASNNATAAQAYGSVQRQVNLLRKHPPEEQRKVYESLSDAEKSMYRAAGYEAPIDHGGGRSLLGSVAHVASDVLSPVFRGPAELAAKGVSEGLHYLGAPLRQLQHAERSVVYNFATSEGWANAWRDTEHGERTFLPSAINKLVDDYGQDTVNIARKLAGGTDPNDLILAQPEAGRQAFAKRLNDDRNIKDAIVRLNNAKISPGRLIAGQWLMNNHPLLGRLVSGATDAVLDVVTDPVLAAGKAAKAYELSSVLVRDASDVARVLEQSPKAQRFLQTAGQLLEEGGPARLGRVYPKWLPLADQLAKENVSNADDLGRWMTSIAGRDAIINGQVGGLAPHNIFILQGGAIFPNASRLKLGLVESKDALHAAIDFADTKGIPLKPLVTLVHTGREFDANAEDAVVHIQRIADYALPRRRADEIVNLWAKAEPGDLGARRDIFRGLIGEVMDGMGVSEDYKKKWFDQFDHATRRSYGVNDRMTLEGGDVAEGFLEGHILSTKWGMPSFRDLRGEAHRQAVLKAAYGSLNNDLTTRFMDRVWKPATLLRIGFPVRAGLEEIVGAALRGSPVGLLRGRLAASAAHDEFQRAVTHMAADVPDAVAAGADTADKWAGAVLWDRTKRAFHAAEGKLAGDRYLEAAREVALDYPDSLPQEIAAHSARGAGFIPDPDNAKRLLREGGRPVPGQLVGTGDFRTYFNGDPMMTTAWQGRIDENIQSRIAHPAFDHFGDEKAQIEAVYENLASDEMAAIRRKARRAVRTSDGRTVGVDATQEEALRDWARVVVDNVNHLAHDSAGNPIDLVQEALRNRVVPKPSMLNAIPEDLRPALVSGPEMVRVYGDGKWSNFVEKGFGHIGDLMNWMARQPMYVHNYAESKAEAEGFRGMFTAAGENVDQHLREIAHLRALDKTIPYIHNPELRSEFAENARNLMPFWFAQEQFYKRWAKTLYHSPESFREGQLTMMGLRHAGFIHKDEQGNDYFFYPMAGAVQQVLSKAAGALLGKDISFPIPVGFSGQVRFATPGTERLGAPSFGPLGGIPMHALADRFPELQELQQAVLGERGAGRAYWEQIVPTTVSRVVHVLTDNPETAPQMHSATLQAIQYLEATGHGLKDTASSIDREEWIDRVKSWARILMVTRTLYGFSVPAAPELQLDPNHMSQEFRNLLGQLPIGDAVTEFMRRHPDATPYTVFQTKSRAGAPLPATTAAVKFMNDNQGFLKAYPEASAWFLPQQASNGFDPVAYREQLALELRKRKGTDEFYSDIKYAEAATDYFDTRDGRNNALKAAAGDPARAAAINQQWAEWKAGFLRSHPTFAEQLQSPDAQIRRGRALTQLRQALADPKTPETKQGPYIRDLIDTYDGYLGVQQSVLGRRDGDAIDIRRNAKEQFLTWAHQYIVDHPEAQAVYQRVIAPEVGDTA